MAIKTTDALSEIYHQAGSLFAFTDNSSATRYVSGSPAVLITWFLNEGGKRLEIF